MSPTSCRCSTPRSKYTAGFTIGRTAQCVRGEAEGDATGVGVGAAVTR
jgi:hypothetical protein